MNKIQTATTYFMAFKAINSKKPKIAMQNISHFITAFLLLLSTQVFAQFESALYFEDTRLQKVKTMEIGSDFVRYQKLDDRLEQNYNILKSDIMLAFHPAGVYHVYNEADDMLIEVDYASFVNNKIDKLIKSDGTVIAADISEINLGVVNYTDFEQGEEASISTENLVAILYKNGEYALHKPVQDVAQALLLARESIKNMDNSIADRGFKKIENDIVADESGSAVEQENTITNDDEVIIEEDDEIPPVRKEEFKEKALDKTKQLEDYLSLVANKNTRFTEANRAIDLAVDLFLDETSIMEVSSASRNTVNKYKIRVYFERLKMLKYDDVRVSWSDISYVSKIRKAEDGTFRGTVTLKQKFEGFIDKKMVYTDITKKNLEVILKTYEKYVKGEKQTLWDVYLGDIGVVQTD